MHLYGGPGKVMIGKLSCSILLITQRADLRWYKTLHLSSVTLVITTRWKASKFGCGFWGVLKVLAVIAIVVLLGFIFFRFVMAYIARHRM